VVNPGTPEERQLKPLSDNNRLRQGDLLRVMTSGGGGWGHPFDRPAATVWEDVLDGFVSPQSVLKDYGVVLDPQTLAVDEVETAKIRKDLCRETAMFHRGRYLHAEEG
jgi:N-methylhydantoinase B